MHLYEDAEYDLRVILYNYIIVLHVVKEREPT